MPHTRYTQPPGFLLFASVMLSSQIWHATVVAAEPFKQPTISYKADFDLSVGSIILLGTTWYIPGKERIVTSFGSSEFKSKTRPFKFALKNLAIGPQPAELFEISKGYKPARPIGLGMGLKR